MDLTNEPVGEKPSWIKRIKSSLNIWQFFEFIRDKCVSLWEWLSKNNPS